MTLINVYKTIFKILGKRRSYQWNVGTLSIDDPCAMLLIEVDCCCSLVIYLQPEFNQTTIVMLQNLSSGIDKDTNSRNRVPHGSGNQELPEKTLLSKTLGVGVHHSDVSAVTILEEVGQNLGVGMGQLRQIVLLDRHGKLMPGIVRAREAGGLTQGTRGLM
jgi:hypothetical protein